LFIASCSGTRNLPEGELLWRCQDKSGRQRNKREPLKAAFEAIVRQNLIRPFSVLDPNYLFIKLLVLKKTKGFRYWLKQKWEKRLFITVK
jgi:hypothetical protein